MSIACPSPATLRILDIFCWPRIPITGVKHVFKCPIIEKCRVIKRYVGCVKKNKSTSNARFQLPQLALYSCSFKLTLQPLLRYFFWCKTDTKNGIVTRKLLRQIVHFPLYIASNFLSLHVYQPRIAPADVNFPPGIHRIVKCTGYAWGCLYLIDTQDRKQITSY